MLGADTRQEIEIRGAEVPGQERVLTPEALDFVALLHRELNPERLSLLQRRAERQARLDAGEAFDFPAGADSTREGEWQVAAAPADLLDRRVEITGPVDRKMMINALNSGASVFMADFEDALSPTWSNVVQGHINLMAAVRRSLSLDAPDGRQYRLNEQTATLLVRPRGWHLTDKHVLVDGEPISASLLDFGLYFFCNAAELLRRGSGPYFYLAKLEGRREARLWNEAFNLAQDGLSIPRGTIRATVLVETIAAAFEMDEILYELRRHAAGLNAGRWDYIFSLIKKLRARPDCVLPDRGQVTMTAPFMRAYTELLVQTCHRRGAHAIGGMAAYIPSRKDPEVNERALARVREDKVREAGDGFDGTWVAHPDLVPVAREVFDGVLGERPHQKERRRDDVRVSAADLQTIRVPGGQITEAGARQNVNVALQYLDAWLGGNGAAAIHNLMEDTATAEISRAQLWQWIRHGAALAEGGRMTAEHYERLRDEELAQLGGRSAGRLGLAAQLLDELVLNSEFIDFLTYKAYPHLD
jgi:malate synthase